MEVPNSTTLSFAAVLLQCKRLRKYDFLFSMKFIVVFRVVVFFHNTEFYFKISVSVVSLFVYPKGSIEPRWCHFFSIVF